MSLISRLTTWVTNQVLTTSALNNEFSNVTNTLNNLDGATTSWTNVKTAALNVTAGAGVTVNSVVATNAAGYFLGAIVAMNQVTDTTTVAAVGTAFTSTNVAASITPKATTHKIKISVTGRASDTSFSATNTYLSIFRGSTDLSNGSGLTGMDGVTNINIEVPVAMIYLDSPATTSATTYTVKIKTTSAASGSWNVSGGTCTILLEEIAA